MSSAQAQEIDKMVHFFTFVERDCEISNYWYAAARPQRIARI